MSGISDIQENNEQILNDIQSLQQMEQQLFNNLETNPNLSTQQQEKIVEKIVEIVEIKNMTCIPKCTGSNVTEMS